MPTTLTWDSSYSVGNVALNNQHKHLMELCNQLAACIEDSKGQFSSRFIGILFDLTGYARRHFKYEESLLQACGYPRLSTQQADHEEYEKHVADALASAKAGTLDQAGLQQLLSNWWNDHILISDMDYRSYLLAPKQTRSNTKTKSRPTKPNGSVVRELRRKTGLSQTEFWSNIGVTQSGGSRYESGRAINEPVRRLLRLAYGTEEEAAESLSSLRYAWRHRTL